MEKEKKVETQGIEKERIEGTEKPVAAEYWYRYGKRIKYVGLYERPGQKPEDAEDWREGLIDPETGQLKTGVITEPVCMVDVPQETDPKEDDEKGRFRQSVQRARGMVEQYALCNDWDYFVTLTLNKDKRARDDLEQFSNAFADMIRRIRKETKREARYLLVPELHKDGVNWHMHGLLKLPDGELRKITSPCREKRPDGKYQWYDDTGHPIGEDAAKSLLLGRETYIWERYEKNFGWCSIERVIDPDAAKVYTTKMMGYMAKTLDEDAGDGKTAVPPWKVLAKGKHLYYASRGLQKREKIAPRDGRDITEGKPARQYNYDKCIIRWYGC